jgi:hypothetical protein
VAKNTRSLKHGVAVSALFSAISVFYGASAQASFYPGHIDPTGTGTVPGFIGNFVVSIDPGCLSDGTNFTNAFFGGSGGCGNASVYSANIDLYSLNSFEPPPIGGVQGTFSMGTSDPQGLLLSTFDIFEVLAFGGQPVEIDTAVMGSVPGTAGPYSGNPFWLEFFFVTDGGIGFVDPAVIFMNSVDPEHRSNEGIVTFGPACQEVGGVPVNCVIGAPEPGVLSLVLGALGGGWLARRRRGNAAKERNRHA